MVIASLCLRTFDSFSLLKPVLGSHSLVFRTLWSICFTVSSGFPQIVWGSFVRLTNDLEWGRGKVAKDYSPSQRLKRIRIHGIQTSWSHTNKAPREKTIGEILLINQLISQERITMYLLARIYTFYSPVEKVKSLLYLYFLINSN